MSHIWQVAAQKAEEVGRKESFIVHVFGGSVAGEVAEQKIHGHFTGLSRAFAISRAFTFFH
jgi:hypothetical protein